MAAPRDPRKEANDYIKKHRVDDLFQELGARLVYERAEDPNQHLLTVLEEIKANRGSSKPTPFFTNDDIITLFEMFDPTGRGEITQSQYYQALKSIGVDTPTVTVPKMMKIDRSYFCKCVGEEVRALSLS